MNPADIAQQLAALDLTGAPLKAKLAISAAIATLAEKSNVIALPVRQRTCWTTLHHLDGRQWATSSHFSPGGAWNWILDTVGAEHRVHEDQIGCIEGDDGDDLVTIDGLPAYRIRHFAK